jgi:hypothetical protein
LRHRLVANVNTVAKVTNGVSVITTKTAANLLAAGVAIDASA